MRIIELKQEYLMEEARPFDSCHASTLVKLANGDILAAYFAGTWEHAPDTAIWLSRRTREGWQAPRKLADFKDVPMWNPVLFDLGGGKVRLFFKAGQEIPIWQTWYMDSVDGGQTFTEPAEVVPGDVSGGRGPVKNKPIRLKNGTILAPASVESADCWEAFTDVSEDGGRTWEKSAPVPMRRVALSATGTANTQLIHRPYDAHMIFGKGIIQPTLWEDETGVHMLCRSTSSRIYRSDSSDGGKSWSLAYDTGLPNNNSGIDLAQLSDGTLVLAYNPRENYPGFYKGARTPLSVAVSQDGGNTFTRLCDLEDTAGSFAYPSMIADSEDTLHVVYTWNRERIRYASFRLEK
ncbi:MAG: exo-alpha-sialidase [Clostridiales bacterium]|nr:exo-alpha-sialidase [Clostridiales bacterium]